MIEELVKEKDKWHRRYNDAEIEIDRLKRENKAYELAIHRLIMERDMAINGVVHCKDCKYFKYGNGCRLQSIDYDWEEQMYADDFCSRGERK